ncbi:hypothetical protein SAMN03159417_00510 [Ralstonia sp. NFACC01]|nr:hypothetical protein SAMN03159417_00510 [Ralstonia sp. NFACC01]
MEINVKPVVQAALALAYLAALGLVLAFHAYALHLDETSETEPTRSTQRQA